MNCFLILSWVISAEFFSLLKRLCQMKCFDLKFHSGRDRFVSLSKFPVGRFLPLVIEGGHNNEFDCMVFCYDFEGNCQIGTHSNLYVRGDQT